MKLVWVLLVFSIYYVVQAGDIADVMNAVKTGCSAIVGLTNAGILVAGGLLIASVTLCYICCCCGCCCRRKGPSTTLQVIQVLPSMNTGTASDGLPAYSRLDNN